MKSSCFDNKTESLWIVWSSAKRGKEEEWYVGESIAIEVWWSIRIILYIIDT